jgi:hypothetical protein
LPPGGNGIPPGERRCLRGEPSIASDSKGVLYDTTSQRSSGRARWTAPSVWGGPGPCLIWRLGIEAKLIDGSGRPALMIAQTAWTWLGRMISP